LWCISICEENFTVELQWLSCACDAFWLGRVVGHLLNRRLFRPLPPLPGETFFSTVLLALTVQFTWPLQVMLQTDRIFMFHLAGAATSTYCVACRKYIFCFSYVLVRCRGIHKNWCGEMVSKCGTTTIPLVDTPVIFFTGLGEFDDRCGFLEAVLERCLNQSPCHLWRKRS
jgi:hypothetical protein